ncbi:putative MFS family arabinose efflux permease [Kibdelosporangium banguiense]|uniref:MFS family arabinose efflux permease n=1 Tax=Kibdelosporangium banguiense TaxID=1365924 RepID=A0ABS4TW32_9PSEU|nr:MFS transporter [Kibdelosporangium banguiense]MBP2328160.1 putative MFS family arabinose efflux permease [Kibdelosporangium banguiense]
MTGASPAPAIGIRVGAALVTGASLGNLGANLMPVLLPGMAGRFHLSNTSSGMVATMQLLATALATLGTASRAARPGRARIATFGLVATVAGFGLAFAAPDLAILTLGNILAGAGLGVVYAAAMAAITATDDTDRASAVAVVGGTLVIAALVIALPEANDAWGGAAGFAVLAACCLPAFWLVRALPDAAEPSHGPASEVPVPVVFLLAVALLGATDQGAWSYSAVLGEGHAGMSAGTVSVVLSIASIASLAGVGLSALAAGKVGRLSIVAAFVAVEGIAKLVIAAVPSGAAYLAAAIVWQICFMGLLVQVLAVAASADRSGRWVAAAGGALAIGTGLGPAPAGWILDSFGAPAFGLVLALATAVAAVPLLRTVRAVCG